MFGNAEGGSLATCGAAGVASLQQLGRYRILEEVGRGSMGTVYRAQDSLIERDVALKVLQQPGTSSSVADREVYTRFLREARAAGVLSHPAIVTIYDVGVDPEQELSYIAMEFVEGEPLETLLERGARLSSERIRQVGIQVASALEAAHQAGVIHRDIKPGNLLLTPSGGIKVADFGIARIQSARMTQQGALLGSPQYMAPEQVRGARVDPRTDLFALGSVLYELATLRPAFGGDDIYDVMRRVTDQEPPPLRGLRPDLPEDLEAVILKALSKRPADRYASASEMRQALEPPRGSGQIPRGAVLVDVLPEDVADAVTTHDVVPTASSCLPAVTPVASGASRPRSEDRRAGWIRLRLALAGAAAILVAIGLYLVVEGPLDPTRGMTLEARAAAGGPQGTRSPFEAPTPQMGPPEPPETPPGPAANASDQGVLPIAAPTPSPTPRPVRPRIARPRPTPTPTPPPAPTPSPTPPATPTPSPTPLLLVVGARHHHRIGGCEGVLRFHQTHVEYDAQENDRDDRSWSYYELRGFAYPLPGKLKLTEAGRDKQALGLKHRDWNFQLREPLPGEALTLLRRKVPETP